MRIVFLLWTYAIARYEEVFAGRARAARAQGFYCRGARAESRAPRAIPANKRVFEFKLAKFIHWGMPRVLIDDCILFAE